VSASAWPAVFLLGLVATLLWLNRRASCQRIFQWAPLPLWCYGVPMFARALGWLPAQSPVFTGITDQVFPIALGLLLLGIDLPAMRRVGLQGVLAMTSGALGIMVGGPLMFWAVHPWLPAEAWKGVGTLAATWTGGSLNMLALRSVLGVPDAIFAPLVVVDAIVAYGWMACLLSCKSFSVPLNRWLHASEPSDAAAPDPADATPMAATRSHMIPAILLAGGIAIACRLLASPLPTGGFIASKTGWTILLVTAGALLLSCWPAVRRLGPAGAAAGYPCLYLVLASLGAQANISALLNAPVWLLIGAGCVIAHVITLLIAGRLWRLSLGILATASQANVGGVISAPLVGAMYQQSLAPVGLVLAIAGNVVGTFLGLASAWLAKTLAGA